MVAWVSLAPHAAVGGELPAMAQQLDPGRSWQSRLPPRVMPRQVARGQRQVNAPVDWAGLCATAQSILKTWENKQRPKETPLLP